MPDLISDGEDVVIASVKSGALNQDAFQRYRFSLPYTLFEFNSFQDILFSNLFNYFGSSLNGGSVDHDNTRKSYKLTCGTANGNYAIAQTKAYWRYQSGKSQVLFQTFIIGTGTSNKTKRIGLFDDSDGIFLEQQDTTLNIVLRSSVSGSPVETRIPQSSWNGDPLNGSGLSGITLDVTKTQIMIIDYQWLGAGRVRVGFEIGNEFVLAHSFYNANENTALYMSSGTLPIRYEIRNTGTTSNTTLEFMCGMIATEAGANLSDLYGPTFSAFNQISVGTTESEIIGIRLNTTFKSNTNRSQVVPALINVFSSSRNTIFRVYYNPVLTGGTWNNVNNDSCVQANNTIGSWSGGRVIDAILGADSTSYFFDGSILSSERMTLNTAGTDSDTLLITGRTTRSNSNVGVNINWKEFWR